VPVGAKVDEMNLSFQASTRFSSDWMFLKLLRDPSRKWRVDMYGQAAGETEWRPLFSKVVGLSEDSSDGKRVPSEEGKAPRAPLAEPREIPSESMRLLERVEGRWL
jgi:hypothetical protein